MNRCKKRGAPPLRIITLGTQIYNISGILSFLFFHRALIMEIPYTIKNGKIHRVRIFLQKTVNILDIYDFPKSSKCHFFKFLDHNVAVSFYKCFENKIKNSLKLNIDRCNGKCKTVHVEQLMNCTI